MVLKRPFSASTASFFAAFSTASSLRLAAFALKGRTAGLHPSSCPKPDLETFQSQDTSGTTTFEKPALPSPKAAGCRGSNHIRHPSPSATQSETRSSPVYAGREIKPLKKLAFRRGRLQSWTGSRSSGTPKTSAHIPPKRRVFSSFRAIHADVLKGMISYRIGFSECEHRRASNGQHARKRLFNDSFPACQGLISGIFLGPRRVLFFCRDSGGPRYWPAAVAGAGFLAAHA